ncbi:sensor histidine kinase [Dactylosporangium sucinum]|uniref:histidine kinase n=1 Tax=Dactylosporangium sucinum TaxID=1424081 RepID=A0A917T7Y2_9ACTN|nr:histidine kinase [Dactylosporangium sucinum]GGM13819.1 two-component sensor histidine kinase [Dactylosporangium sucinum]
MTRRRPWRDDLRAARHAHRIAHRQARLQQRLDRLEKRHWRGPSPVAIAVFIALVQVFGTRAAAYGTTEHVLDKTGYLLLVGGAAALVFRQKLPLFALAGALAATVAYFSLRYPDGPGFIAAIVAVFTALAAGYRALTLLAVAAAYTVFVVRVHDVESTARLVVVGICALMILSFGEAARVRGLRYAQLAREREEQEALARAEEERARKEQKARRASDERLLIARELHDVIGHHLSLINVQAGVGLHLMDDNPEQARTALAAIKHASAEALRETRAVLAGLNPGEAAPRTPAPGLADLERLAAEARGAGLPVAVETVGTVVPLPPQVDRAAYRIVQEALTNVRRHAGPDASATVVVGYAPGEVSILVSDTGTGATAAVEGNGIAGMRHRAATFGGTVDAGPRDGGGFEVHARIPLREEQPT